MFSLQSLIIQSSTVTVRNRRTAFRAVFQKKKKKKYFNNGTRRVKKQRATKVVTRSNGCSDRINPRCHQKERSIPKTKKKRGKKEKKENEKKNTCKNIQQLASVIYPCSRLRETRANPREQRRGTTRRYRRQRVAGGIDVEEKGAKQSRDKLQQQQQLVGKVFPYLERQGERGTRARANEKVSERHRGREHSTAGGANRFLAAFPAAASAAGGCSLG
mgnify:CR=1 FL=1